MKVEYILYTGLSKTPSTEMLGIYNECRISAPTAAAGVLTFEFIGGHLVDAYNSVARQISRFDPSDSRR